MDARVKNGKRQKGSDSILRNKFEAAWLTLLADFKRTDMFKHAQTMGNEREAPVRTLVTDNLPGCYSAVGGEVVDLSSRTSGQIDVIVYNAHKNSAFVSGTSYILPAEAPLVTIEVKSRLTRAEMIRSLESAAKLKSLKPLGRSLGEPRLEGKPFDDKFRYLH